MLRFQEALGPGNVQPVSCSKDLVMEVVSTGLDVPVQPDLLTRTGSSVDGSKTGYSLFDSLKEFYPVLPACVTSPEHVK